MQIFGFIILAQIRIASNMVGKHRFVAKIVKDIKKRGMQLQNNNRFGLPNYQN